MSISRKLLCAHFNLTPACYFRHIFNHIFFCTNLSLVKPATPLPGPALYSSACYYLSSIFPASGIFQERSLSLFLFLLIILPKIIQKKKIWNRGLTGIEMHDFHVTLSKSFHYFGILLIKIKSIIKGLLEDLRQINALLST